MTEDKLQALLSGYASGTLTSEEQAELFATALERQDIFDALLREQTLRDTLDDPQIRSKLLSEVQPIRRRTWLHWNLSGLRWIASAAALVLVSGIALEVWHRNVWHRNVWHGNDVAPKTSQAIRRSEAPSQPATKPIAPQPPASAQKQATAPAKPPFDIKTKPQEQALVTRKPSVQPAVPQDLPEPPKISVEPQVAAIPENTPPVAPPPPAPVPQTKGFVARGAADTATSNRAAELAQITPTLSTSVHGQQVSPRLLFQSGQKEAVLTVSGSAGILQGGPMGMTGPSVLNRKAKQTARPQTIESMAIRVALHLPGESADLDWRTLSPPSSTGENQTLVIQVDTTANGYIAILGKQILAPGNTLTLAHSAVRVPVTMSAGQQPITVVYSPAPLTPDRIEQLLKGALSPVEEAHNGSEHALYAGTTGPARELILRFVVNLH